MQNYESPLDGNRLVQISRLHQNTACIAVVAVNISINLWSRIRHYKNSYHLHAIGLNFLALQSIFLTRAFQSLAIWVSRDTTDEH
jgi:hypothetical protein